MTPDAEGRAASAREEGASAVGPAAGSLGQQIARNTMFMLVGRLVYVAGWTLIAPFMLAKLGADRFGLWSLLSVVSGLYVTFDLGISSALTKFVAEFRAAGDHAALRAVFTRGAALYFALSVAFAAALALFREPLLDFFRVAPALRAEAGGALVAAGVSYGMLNAFMLLSSVLWSFDGLSLGRAR